MSASVVPERSAEAFLSQAGMIDLHFYSSHKQNERRILPKQVPVSNFRTAP